MLSSVPESKIQVRFTLSPVRFKLFLRAIAIIHDALNTVVSIIQKVGTIGLHYSNTPTALKRHAPSGLIFLMINPRSFFNVCSNLRSLCRINKSNTLVIMHIVQLQQNSYSYGKA